MQNEFARMRTKNILRVFFILQMQIKPLKLVVRREYLHLESFFHSKSR